MSFFNYIKLEFVKVKGSFIMYLIATPLILSTIMNITDVSIRKNMILTKYKKTLSDGFYVLIAENHLALVWPMLLMFSIILIGVSLYYIDLKNNLLTHIFANPISKSKYYLSKQITLVTITTLIIILEGTMLVIIGTIFNLSNHIDVELIIRYMWFEFFSSLGLISFQGFLFSISKDAMFLITINIIFTCLSIPFLGKPSIVKFNPYLQLANCMPFSDSKLLIGAMICSIIYMIVFNILGNICINYKDIKEE